MPLANFSITIRKCICTWFYEPLQKCSISNSESVRHYSAPHVGHVPSQGQAPVCQSVLLIAYCVDLAVACDLHFTNRAIESSKLRARSEDSSIYDAHKMAKD